MNIDQFLKNKKVLIFGLGRQGGGLGDASYLAKHNIPTRITDQLTIEQLGIKKTDLDSSLELSLGGHKQEDIDWADIIIKNPAVPDNHPLITYATQTGKLVTSSIALFVKYSPVPTIGITGTRGKTTTTKLIAHILNRVYPKKIIIGGNIPNTSPLELFDQLKGSKYAVLELSSFQLHSFETLKTAPTYAVITNLYPDHLNRYPTMAKYQTDKELICKYLTTPPGFVVYNLENQGSIDIASVTQATKHGYTMSLANSYKTPLIGDHNQSNIAAAVTLTKNIGIDEGLIRDAVASFAAVPYRLEQIAVINEVSYINDTTATTPTATIIALRSQSKPTILICGGASKNLPYDKLLEEIKNNQYLKKIIILGSKQIKDFTDQLKTLFPDKVAGTVSSMTDAVRLATSLSKSGDVVLLSPAFSSFDLFNNEFDRGDQFNLAVNNIK